MTRSLRAELELSRVRDARQILEEFSEARYSGCPATCVLGGIERACVSPDEKHSGQHRDADGSWLVDGREVVIDAQSRWLSFGEWWA